MLSLKTMLSISLLLTGMFGSVAYHPLVGIIGYIFTYNINPGGHWWGASLSSLGIRFSLFLAVATGIGMVIHRSKLKFRSFLETQEILLIIFLGIIWLSIPLGLGFNMGESNAIKMAKVAIILLMASHVITNSKRYEAMIWTLIFAGIYLGYETYNAPSWKLSGGRLNVGIGGSDFAEGNFLGAHFAMLLPFIGIMFLKGSWKSKVIKGSWKIKIICLVSGVFVTNSIILCRSRGVFLAITAGIVASMIFAIRGSRPKIVVGLLVAIAGAIFLTDPGFWRRIGNIPFESSEISGEGRMLVWEAALSMVADHPQGIGEGNFKRYVGLYNPGIPGKDTHNTFLRCLAELGIQGSFILLLLIGNAFFVLFRLKKDVKVLPDRLDFLWHIYGLKIALIIYLVAGMFITHTYIEEFYWLLMFPVFLKRAFENKLKTTLALKSVPGKKVAK